MRRLLPLALSLACLPAVASQPGQPLDCSDWVFLQPGYSCIRFGPPGDGSAHLDFGSPSQFDNHGRFFRLSPGRSIPIGSCGGGELYRTELQWLDGSSWSTLAYVDDRCVSPFGVDAIQPGGGGLTFDDKSGQMVLNLISSCNGEPDCSAYPPGTGDYWLASIGGFATTFEVLQTYTPQASTGFRVPYMPEGMGGADYFDTYWGPLTHPIDFTQTHPLQCGYPTTPPKVGDYMSVADTVPTSVPGQGVYYITATTYQGQKRDGRQTVNGHLVGRDPTLLPACVRP